MNGFTLAEHILSPSRGSLVTTKIFMPLLHHQSYSAVLVIVVVHSCHGWVGLLVASLLRKLAWCPLVPWKLVFREGASGSVPAQRPLDPVSEVRSGFSNRGLPSASGGWKVNSNRLYVLGILWRTWIRASLSATADLLRKSLWFFEGALPGQMRKAYLNYIFIYRIMHLQCLVEINS